MHIKRQYHNCVLPKCSGGKSSPCNNLPKSVWMCCLENDIWLIACHLPGVLNVEADQGFRQFYGRTEWQLHLGIFSKSTDILGTPKIDMFVCRLDKQLPQYVSWKPDPGACHVGAFSFSSNGKFLYIFPPCSLLSRCLQKVGNDQTLALLVVPVWPTQVWWPRVLRLPVANPLMLPQHKEILTLPHSGTLHPP